MPTAPNNGEEIINNVQPIPVSSIDHAKFVIIPQQTFTATAQMPQGYMQQLNGEVPQSEEDLINFNPVTVVFDGVVYTNIEGFINDGDAGPQLLYGDFALTQYPFGIATIPGATSTDPQWMIGVADTNEHAVEMFSGQDSYVYPSILDALKDDMDRIADTLDPNQADPMKSTMDRIADAIEGGYTPTPTPSKIILVPEQEVTLEPFTDGLYIANIEASDELVQYQEKDIMCSINGTTGTLYWENGLGWVFPPDITNPSEIQVCITGTAVSGQISFISSTSISPCVIEAYIDESVTPTSPLSIAHVKISNFCDHNVNFIGAYIDEDITTYGEFTVAAKTSSVVSAQNISVILYNENAVVTGNSKSGHEYLLSVTSGNATVIGKTITITGDCEIAINPGGED